MGEVALASSLIVILRLAEVVSRNLACHSRLQRRKLLNSARGEFEEESLPPPSFRKKTAGGGDWKREEKKHLQGT
eukprot:1034314-Amphidinium_carterae.1